SYTFLLGLIALLGYMAIAAGVHVTNNNNAVPALLLRMMPAWFAGFCFAAIAIGGLVPAAIMAISASSLFTRSIYRRYLRPSLAPAGETAISKRVSLLLKLAALAFVLYGKPAYVINLQLLGSIWILQSFPTVVFGLYRHRWHPLALLAGWAAGMIAGTAMAWSQGIAVLYPLHLFGRTYSAYAAMDALGLNLALVLALSPLCRGLGLSHGSDETDPLDYDEFRPEPAPANA
ncbi:MAG: sodium:solute symporter family transporter, partial [Terriglobales bacterium]